MSLLEKMKKERGRPAVREPWPLTAWAAVAAIVQAFNLTSLAQLEDGGACASAPQSRERLSLFPLLSAGQYQLTQEILRRYDNPYLGYARTPAEIVLSWQLCRHRPNIAPVQLATTPLAELWGQTTGLSQEP
ncbi:MAG: hypothetical protein ACUVRZ_03550 [Desulfobacca sp.]|uniref:hypothetical protein n=1 Tax=Desulfobacca sp. TaxID=2067990 RepID=UPI00404A686F